MIIGIDPGSSSGHIGIINPKKEEMTCIPLPSDLPGLLLVLNRLPKAPIYLERVGASRSQDGDDRTQGIASIAKFLRHTGWVEGILAALARPFILVAPQTWTRTLDIPKGPAKQRKKINCEFAKKLFCQHPDNNGIRLTQKNSDAFLIAYYGLTDQRARERFHKGR